MIFAEILNKTLLYRLRSFYLKFLTPMLQASDSRKLSDENIEIQTLKLLQELGEQIETESSKGVNTFICTLSEYPKNLSDFFKAISQRGYWSSYPIPIYEYSLHQPNTDTYYDRNGYQIRLWNSTPGLFDRLYIFSSYFQSSEGTESYVIEYD
jgi:hypothetical protein